MSARESRPDEVEAAAEFRGSGNQLTVPEARTEILNAADRHRKHIRIAHEFAAEWVGRFLYVVGIGWHRWDGRRWALDHEDKQAQDAVMQTVRVAWQRAIGDRELTADLMTCSTAAGVRGVLELAAALPGMGALASEMDADPYLLNVANGVLDLQSLELLPHGPEHRMTKVTRAAYRPGEVSTEWVDFLEEVLPDFEVREYLKRFFGLSLVGKVLEHIFTIATGTGRNGKGVAYGACSFALGDYATAADPALMEVVKSNPNSPSPAFFDLRGRRLVVMSETDTKIRLSAAVLKRLTGGDALKARALHKDPIEFMPSHLFLFVTNHLPELPSRDADPAVWARVRVVPFNVVIPKSQQDPRLPERLELSADAILTWMVEGLGEYWRRGLDEPDAVSAATDEYADEQDVLQRFIDDECEVDPGSSAGSTTTVLHKAYQEWCVNEGLYKRDILGRGMFGQALDKLGFDSVKTSKGMARAGLRLRDDQLLDQVVQEQPEDPEEQARLDAQRDAEITRLKAELTARGLPVHEPDYDTTDTDA